ncbi:MAG: hypothetical protein ACHQ4H_12950 [Ktedonobacterales bacterium]
MNHFMRREQKVKATMNKMRSSELVLAILTPVLVFGACFAALLIPAASTTSQAAGVVTQAQTISLVARYGLVTAAILLGVPLLLGITVLAGTLAHVRRNSPPGQKVMIASASLLLLASIGLTPFAGPYFFPAAITAMAAVLSSTRAASDSTPVHHAPLAG